LLSAYHSGSGEFGAFVVGPIAGALTLAAGLIAVASFRSPVIRTAIALVSAVPAAIAGITRLLVSRSSVYRLSCGSRFLR